MELLYEEITKEEQLIQQRKEHKKLRRKKRKEKKAGQEEKENCEVSSFWFISFIQFNNKSLVELFKEMPTVCKVYLKISWPFPFGLLFYQSSAEIKWATLSSPSIFYIWLAVFVLCLPLQWFYEIWVNE